MLEETWQIPADLKFLNNYVFNNGEFDPVIDTFAQSDYYEELEYALSIAPATGLDKAYSNTLRKLLYDKYYVDKPAGYHRGNVERYVQLVWTLKHLPTEISPFSVVGWLVSTSTHFEENPYPPYIIAAMYANDMYNEWITTTYNNVFDFYLDRCDTVQHCLSDFVDCVIQTVTSGLKLLIFFPSYKGSLKDLLTEYIKYCNENGDIDEVRYAEAIGEMNKPFCATQVTSMLDAYDINANSLTDYTTFDYATMHMYLLLKSKWMQDVVDEIINSNYLQFNPVAYMSDRILTVGRLNMSEIEECRTVEQCEELIAIKLVQ